MSNWVYLELTVRVCPCRAEITVRAITKTFKEVVGFDVLRALRSNNHDLWISPMRSTPIVQKGLESMDGD